MKIAGCLIRRTKRKPPAQTVNLWSLLVLAVCFLAGAAAGSFMSAGNITQAAQEAVFLDGSSIYGTADFLSLLLSCAKYHIAVVLCATSLLGVVLIPVISAFRGFALACTAASVAASAAGNGVLLTAVVLGLPSLLTVPALFLLGCDGMRFSGRLMLLSEGEIPASPPQRAGHAFEAALLAVLAAAAIEYAVVPPLVALLIG